MDSLIPTLDRERGIANVNGNVFLYKKLLTQFSLDHGNDPAAIRQAMKREDLVTAQRIAHTLKAVAATIGAGKTRDLAFRVEQQLKQEEIPDAASLAALDDALDDLLCEIQTSKERERPATPDMAFNTQSLKELRPDIQAGNNLIHEKSRILIVDDDRISIQAIAASLRHDYKIMAATNFEQAMKAVYSEFAPDLILLDVMMPDVDGFETCRRLKADPVSKNIPVIFLTASDQNSDEARGLDMGAVDYIVKPVTPAIVRARVQTHIELQRHVKALERAYRTIETQRDRMEEELQVAQQLQQSLLPAFALTDTDEDVSVYASMSPAREMSGDFYDVFYLDHGHLCICIGDVAGKGVPAALFMGISKALIRAKAGDYQSTADIVTAVNSEIMKNNDACMFVTLFIATIEIRTGRVVYTNAGHNPPFIKPSDGSLRKIEDRHGPPAGIGETEYGEATLWLSRDDVLILYTDGVTEAQNTEGVLFGEENLVRVLERDPANSPRALIASAIDAVESFVDGAPRADDLTLLSVKYNIDPAQDQCLRYEAVLSNHDIQSRSIAELVARFLEPVALTKAHHEVIGVVMDEMIDNILRHGMPDDRKADISIVLEHGTDHLKLDLTDNGIPFNPADAPAPDTTSGLHQRKVGGLGIHLCRTLMDEMFYERKNLRNHLTLVKRLENHANGSPDDNIAGSM